MCVAFICATEVQQSVLCNCSSKIVAVQLFNSYYRSAEEHVYQYLQKTSFLFYVVTFSGNIHCIVRLIVALLRLMGDLCALHELP